MRTLNEQTHKFNVKMLQFDAINTYNLDLVQSGRKKRDVKFFLLFVSFYPIQLLSLLLHKMVDTEMTASPATNYIHKFINVCVCFFLFKWNPYAWDRCRWRIFFSFCRYYMHTKAESEHLRVRWIYILLNVSYRYRMKWEVCCQNPIGLPFHSIFLWFDFFLHRNAAII